MQSHKQLHLNWPAGAQAMRIDDAVRIRCPPEPSCFCMPGTALLFFCTTVPYALHNEETQEQMGKNISCWLPPQEHELWPLAQLSGAHSTRGTQNARKLPGTLHQSNRVGAGRVWSGDKEG